MKTTRLEYPEVYKPAAQTTRTIQRVAVESWPSPLAPTSPISPTTPPPPPASSTTTTTTTTTSSTLLSEHDTNKHMPKSTRKPKRRNNMRYMTQPVRLIEIQEIQEED